jgi:hypothetical protein
MARPRNQKQASAKTLRVHQDPPRAVAGAARTSTRTHGSGSGHRSGHYTRTRALSVQVQDHLPDALALPLGDLGDRDPSRLLTCWEILLGRGYTTSLNRSENKDYLLLHRHPWMAVPWTTDARPARAQ